MTTQATDALNLANEARARRSQLKGALKAGTERLDSALSDPPPWLEGARVIDLVCAVRGVGKQKARMIMRGARLHEGLRVRSFTAPQREELISQIAYRAPGPWQSHMAACAD